jgi:hypothetical protein
LAEAAARSPGWAATVNDLAGMAAADARRGYPAGSDVENALPAVAESSPSHSPNALDKHSPTTYAPEKKRRKKP